MKIVKRKTGCWCSNCDMHESEYTIHSPEGNHFKLHWEDKGEIAFCEDCARKLFKQLAEALEVEI